MGDTEKGEPIEKKPRITAAEGSNWNPGTRRLVAEAVGAFGLVAVAGLADVAGFLTGGVVTPLARAIAPGLFVMAMIYAIGDVSGLHINPAVTLGFTLKRLFPPRWVPTYVIAQLIGATAAGIGLVVLSVTTQRPTPSPSRMASSNGSHSRSRSFLRGRSSPSSSEPLTVLTWLVPTPHWQSEQRSFCAA